MEGEKGNVNRVQESCTALRPSVADRVNGLSSCAAVVCFVTRCLFLNAGPICHALLLVINEKDLQYNRNYVDYDNKPDWCSSP